jgi:hypothetical protein
LCCNNQAAENGTDVKMGGAPPIQQTRDLGPGFEKRPIWHKANRRALFYCAVMVFGAFLYGEPPA